MAVKEKQKIPNLLNKEDAPFDMKALGDVYHTLTQILQNINQVVWLLDLKSDQILYVSPAFEFIWGRTCESFYSDPSMLIESVHPEDRVKVMSATPDDNRISLNYTYRILRPDGTLRWISANKFLIREESQDTLYEICIAQDITDQKQVDQTLRKALDRSREQFTLSRRMSLARKPEAVLKTLMSASELRAANCAFVLFFESPAHSPSREIDVVTSWSSTPSRSVHNSNESLGEISLFEELAILDLFHPSKPVVLSDISTDNRLAPLVRDVLLEKEIQTVAIFPLVALGNWLGCLLVLFTLEKYFELIELRHIKVLVDQASITLYNLKLLEIEAESRHEAERANEIRTRFLAMVSHELRTPLTSIKGFTTTLLAEDVIWEPEEQHDFIQIIQQETNRLQELIDHLLDLSRLEAGMLPITLEPHSFQEIIEEAMPQFQVITQKHALSLQLLANPPLILVDIKRIAQVLVNLVHNAALYSPEGTEIILKASVRAGFMQVSIIDFGPGILPADRKRVFQAFRRGVHEENSVTKGAGLGLAICKGLLEAHGGRIWIKKQTNPGTTVSFTIPLVPSNVPVISPGKVE